MNNSSIEFKSLKFSLKKQIEIIFYVFKNQKYII